jgi:hypothetical protein
MARTAVPAVRTAVAPVPAVAGNARLVFGAAGLPGNADVLKGLGEGVRPAVCRCLSDHGRHLLSSSTLDSPHRPEVAPPGAIHPIE